MASNVLSPLSVLQFAVGPFKNYLPATVFMIGFTIFGVLFWDMWGFLAAGITLFVFAATGTGLIAAGRTYRATDSNHANYLARAGFITVLLPSWGIGSGRITHLCAERLLMTHTEFAPFLEKDILVFTALAIVVSPYVFLLVRQDHESPTATTFEPVSPKP